MSTQHAMKFEGKWIEEVEVDGVDTRDYPDFVDAYITHAVWVATGVSLDDGELERLTDELQQDGTLNEMCMEVVF